MNININIIIMKMINVYAPVVPKERKSFFSSKYLPDCHPTILA